MPLYTVYYISVNCSTFFGWLLHPSSGAHITVITVSDTGQTVSATFRCSGTVGTVVPTVPLLWYNHSVLVAVRYGRPLTQSDYTRSCIHTIVLLRTST